VNGTGSVKFLEVPAASLVQAIEKNLSAFVVNVIGDRVDVYDLTYHIRLMD
ncbi:hypothetical protein Tco_1075975, partial [Tanacetum coccineum]